MTILFLDANADTRGPRTEALQKQPEWTVHSVASVTEARTWISRADRLDLLITEAIPAASGNKWRQQSITAGRSPPCPCPWFWIEPRSVRSRLRSQDRFPSTRRVSA